MLIEKNIAGLEVGDNRPVRVMGVINLSRESFYKGSVVEPGAVLDTALAMIDQGADMIDVGARSTWPLAQVISRQEEKDRLIPALAALKDVNTVISVDTMFHDIADAALSGGADLINDVSGMTMDEKMIDVVRDHSCPVIVMASKKKPGDVTGMNDVMDTLAAILKRAEENSIHDAIIDPAIGKWVPEKYPHHDFEVIDNMDRLRVFGKPILAALSRKSFIGDTLNKPATERLYGSIAAAAVAVYKGAHIVRTHDVAQTVDAVRIAERIRGKMPHPCNRFEIEVLRIRKPDDAYRFMRSLDVTDTGSCIMKDKTATNLILVRNITTTEALIIKQEMLAKGGDAALPRDAVSHEKDNVDVLIIGTLLQIKRLIRKLKKQARNLPYIAGLIDETIQMEQSAEYRYR